MICSFYTHKTEFDQLEKQIRNHFPKAKIKHERQDEFKIILVETKKGLFSKNILKVAYRQRIKPSFELAHSDSGPLEDNLKGLHGFVSSIETPHEKVKSLFLHKIQTINAEFSLIEEKGNTDNLGPLIQAIASDFDTFIFAQPQTLINPSHGQVFLDAKLNLLLDGAGNSETEDINVQIDAELFAPPQVELSQDQVERKKASEKKIEAYPIRINKNLPCIESETATEIRSPKEVAERAVILAVVNLVAFNTIPPEEAMEYLNKYELGDLLTPKEIDFLNNPTDEKKSQETWKCEGIWVLLWALKQVDELPFPDHLCDLGNVPSGNYPIGQEKSPLDFISKCTELRTPSEILYSNDFYYRLDWAAVDARIKSQAFEHAHPGVIYERHYALNWLINYRNQPWDQVSCDT